MIFRLFAGIPVFMGQEILRLKNSSVEVILHPPGPDVFKEESITESTELNVYVSEYVMKRWQGRTVWNLYHAGIAFEVANSETSVDSVPDPRAVYLLDYNALFDDDIMQFIVPSADIPNFFLQKTSLAELISQIVTYYTGSTGLTMQWENLGQLRLVNSRPVEYTNFTRVGKVSGDVFKRFRSWAVQSWVDRGDTFDLFTVVDPTWKTHFLKPKICHEFVEDALTWLGNQSSGSIKAPKPLFRDTIVFYAESVTPVDLSNAREVRDLIRFFRVFAANWESFSSSFARARDLAAKCHSLGMRVISFSRGKLYWIKLAGGFMDYCYVERRLSAGTRTPRQKCLSDDVAEGDRSWDTLDWLIFLEITFDNSFVLLSSLLLAWVGHRYLLSRYTQ